jgi:hypothetical protein
VVGYIKEIADDIVKVHSPTAALNLVRALSEEINRLDPREFVPAGQYRFVKLRMRAADIARVKALQHSDPSGFIAFGQEGHGKFWICTPVWAVTLIYARLPS